MYIRSSSCVVALCVYGCTSSAPEVSPPGPGIGEGTSTGAGLGASTGADGTGTGMGTGMGTGQSMGASTSPETSSEPTDSATEGGCTDGCPGQVCVEDQCVSVVSCQELEQIDAEDTLPSGVYELDPDGNGDAPPYAAYCELEHMGGGWTLVLKAYGDEPTFEWGSSLWTNQETFQPQFPDLDRNEAKLASYVLVPVGEVLVGMEHPIGTDPDALMMNWLVLPVGGDSLYDLISPGDRVETNLGRKAWKGLIEGSSLQSQCNREGLNVRSDTDDYVRQRIGIIGNENSGCGHGDSRIGVGGFGSTDLKACDLEGFPTGNSAGCDPDNGDVNLPAFAAVFVR